MLLIRTQLRAQHNAYDGYFGRGASTSREAAEREEIVLASFAPGAVIAEVARQFDVSTILIYKWRREAQQSTAMFVPAVMAEDEGSLVPDVPEGMLADSAAILEDLAGGTMVSIAATAPARLVLAVLRALR